MIGGAKARCEDPRAVRATCGLTSTRIFEDFRDYMRKRGPICPTLRFRLEMNSDPAVFILTRTGDLSAPLVVDYAMGGTALHGTDYRPLSGTVTRTSGGRAASR